MAQPPTRPHVCRFFQRLSQRWFAGNGFCFLSRSSMPSWVWGCSWHLNASRSVLKWFECKEWQLQYCRCGSSVEFKLLMMMMIIIIMTIISMFVLITFTTRLPWYSPCSLNWCRFFLLSGLAEKIGVSSTLPFHKCAPLNSLQLSESLHMGFLKNVISLYHCSYCIGSSPWRLSIY